VLTGKLKVSSSDEKTGIQALSHLKTTPEKPGQQKRIESEYTRNGTTCLIAARDICTGKIISYHLGQTRTEKDYLNHIKAIVASDPTKNHVIVADQLNTHKSESLVRWIASECSIKIDLGVKGVSGILKSQITRMAFLENRQHKISFFYTPKHCSWMNQIENWFSILERKVIRNGQFHSVTNLEKNISNFIHYYNELLAKPIKWTFSGEKYRTKIKN
jgi:transposase